MQKGETNLRLKEELWIQPSGITIVTALEEAQSLEETVISNKVTLVKEDDQTMVRSNSENPGGNPGAGDQRA